MNLNLRRLQRRLRWGTWIASACCAAYLFMRYDFMTLPEDGCSPLLRFSTGSRLLLDRWPSHYVAGDALLFRGRGGLLFIGVVARTSGEEPGVEDGALWIVTDNPDCPGEDSDDFGWIERESCAARIVLAWPW